MLSRFVRPVAGDSANRRQANMHADTSCRDKRTDLCGSASNRCKLLLGRYGKRRFRKVPVQRQFRYADWPAR